MYTPSTTLLNGLSRKDIFVAHGVVQPDYISTYATLRASKLLLVVNDEPLNLHQVVLMLYALLIHKPILITNTPTYDRTVPHIDRELINKRLAKIFLCNIALFDRPDQEEVLARPYSTINYTLTKSEHTLIRASIRAHFRTI